MALETSSFHLTVDEMTITLDGVSCLLHISIHGKLINHRIKISHERGAALLACLLGVDLEFVVVEYENTKGARISFRCMKQIFPEHHLKAINLANVAESETDRNEHQIYFTYVYHLYMIGCTIFIDTSNKHI